MFSAQQNEKKNEHQCWKHVSIVWSLTVCKNDSVQLNDEAIEKTKMQSRTVDGDFFLRTEIYFLRTKIQLK